MPSRMRPSGPRASPFTSPDARRKRDDGALRGERGAVEAGVRVDPLLRGDVQRVADPQQPERRVQAGQHRDRRRSGVRHDVHRVLARIAVVGGGDPQPALAVERHRCRVHSPVAYAVACSPSSPLKAGADVDQRRRSRRGRRRRFAAHPVTAMAATYAASRRVMFLPSMRADSGNRL